jgi:oligopeptide transport system substrate-binding protein
VPQATIDARGDQWTTQAVTYITNGPCLMSEINLGESYVLAKNPQYWDADNVHLDQITLRLIPEASTALIAFERGEISGQLTVPPSDVARLKTSDSGLVVTQAYATTFFNINNAKAPYDNPLVRKALNLAIDRNTIINDVLQNGGTPAYSIVAPGYVVDGRAYEEGRPTFDLGPSADPAAAQQAPADAGYPGGQGFPTLQLSYYTDDTVKLMVEAIADQLKTNLGITVEISNEEWAVYFDNIQAGKYEVGAMGWGADYFHPMSFLQLLQTDDANNNVFYSNPDYDALVIQAQSETDPAQAMDLMRQADDLASAQYPVLNVFYRANMMLVSPQLQGVYRTVLNNLYFRSAQLAG